MQQLVYLKKWFNSSAFWVHYKILKIKSPYILQLLDKRIDKIQCDINEKDMLESSSSRCAVFFQRWNGRNYIFAIPWGYRGLRQTGYSKSLYSAQPHFSRHTVITERISFTCIAPLFVFFVNYYIV